MPIRGVFSPVFQKNHGSPTRVAGEPFFAQSKDGIFLLYKIVNI